MSNESHRPPRIAVLVSGGGRSLENLAEQIDLGHLDCELGLVVSDRPKIKALDRAHNLGIDAVTIPRAEFENTTVFSTAIFSEIEKRGCELVVLAGFLRLIELPDRWVGRVLNIHPSLLPDFGGKGFYGDHVHSAVLASGKKTSGCTVHYVTNEYDTGPILLQRSVQVEADDDVHKLGSRVFEEEKIALPEAIRSHLSGQVRFEAGRAVRT
ncbi:MAG: phosphoribosylglycinamide formyltransferase-1 [Planctomycetota bacterium]|jgi:phosphoribosylglycinamide formyltransferase-1